MTKVLVFGRMPVVAPIVNTILANGDVVEALVVVTEERDSIQHKLEQDTLVIETCDSTITEEMSSLAQKASVLVSAYWPYLFEEAFINLFDGRTVNLHPALLPWGRGWYPHVHSILEGRSGGVTLHVMDALADSGPVWAQEPIDFGPWVTGAEAHRMQAQAIVDLFGREWANICDGKIEPSPQVGNAVYFAKDALGQIDTPDLDAPTTMREVLTLLRGRCFNERSYVNVEVAGERKFLHIAFSDNGYLDESRA